MKNLHVWGFLRNELDNLVTCPFSANGDACFNWCPFFVFAQDDVKPYRTYATLQCVTLPVILAIEPWPWPWMFNGG